MPSTSDQNQFPTKHLGIDISSSPFFQQEKMRSNFRSERMRSGMNVKRSTITADAFKKGTSQESAGNIENRVANNERKITLLKNIFKLRKENVDNKLEGGGQSVGLKGILDNIASTVDSIRSTLIEQQEFDRDKADDARISAAAAARAKQEKDAEKEKFAGIKKIGDKVLAPVKSLWSKIWDFISIIFLGKVLLGILDWFGDKENRGKVKSLIGFVKTWWPALVAAVLLFGTGFGGMVALLVGAAAAAVPKLIAAGLALKGAIAANPIAAAVATGTALTIGGIAAAVMGRKGDDKDDKGDGKEGGTKLFHEGGIVPGSGNKDTVHAMLTPGEFVFSADAVKQYGANTLAGMNAAAGGNNTGSPSAGFAEGGMVEDEQSRVDKITSNEWSPGPGASATVTPETTKPLSPPKESGESTPNMEVNIKQKPAPIYNARGRLVGYTSANEIKLSPNQNKKSVEGISKFRSKQNGGVTVVQSGGDTPSSDDTQPQDSGGGKIPIFEPGMMRDSSKIKTLGILIL